MTPYEPLAFFSFLFVNVIIFVIVYGFGPVAIAGELLRASFGKFFSLIDRDSQEIDFFVDGWPKWSLLFILRLKTRLGVEIFHGFVELPGFHVRPHEVSYNFGLLIILELN